MNFSSLLPFPANAGTFVAQSEPLSAAPTVSLLSPAVGTEEQPRFVDVLNSLNGPTNVPAEPDPIVLASESEDSRLSQASQSVIGLSRRPPEPDSHPAVVSGGSLPVVSSSNNSQTNETTPKLQLFGGQALEQVESVRHPDIQALSRPPSKPRQPNAPEPVPVAERDLQFIDALADLNADLKSVPSEGEIDLSLSGHESDLDSNVDETKFNDEDDLIIDEVPADFRERLAIDAERVESEIPQRSLDSAKLGEGQQARGNVHDNHAENVRTSRDEQIASDKRGKQDLELPKAGSGNLNLDDLNVENAPPEILRFVNERSPSKQDTNPNPGSDEGSVIKQSTETAFVDTANTVGVESTIVPQPTSETKSRSRAQDYSPSEPTTADAAQSPITERSPEIRTSTTEQTQREIFDRPNESPTGPIESDALTDGRKRPEQINPVKATPPLPDPQQNSPVETFDSSLPDNSSLAIDPKPVARQSIPSIDRENSTATVDVDRNLDEIRNQESRQPEDPSARFEAPPSGENLTAEPRTAENRTHPSNSASNDESESGISEPEVQFDQEPMIDSSEPLIDSSEPMIDSSEPMIDSSEPLTSGTESEPRRGQPQAQSLAATSAKPSNPEANTQVANNPAADGRLVQPPTQVQPADPQRAGVNENSLDELASPIQNSSERLQDSASSNERQPSSENRNSNHSALENLEATEFDDSSADSIDLPDQDTAAAIQTDGSNVLESRPDHASPAKPDLAASSSDTVPLASSNLITGNVNDSAIPTVPHTPLLDSRGIESYAASSLQSSETGSISSFDIETVSALRNQVSQTLLSELRAVTRSGEASEILMDLHPAELGRLTLRVGFENESVNATIVASELATNDLLIRDKQILVDALREQGLDVGSFEVSYGGSEAQEHAGDSDSTEQRRSFSSETIVAKRPTIATQNRTKSSSGINLIA